MKSMYSDEFIFNDFNEMIKQNSMNQVWIEIIDNQWKICSTNKQYSINKVVEKYIYQDYPSRKVHRVAIDTKTEFVIISYYDYEGETEMVEPYCVLSTKSGCTKKVTDKYRLNNILEMPLWIETTWTGTEDYFYEGSYKTKGDLFSDIDRLRKEQWDIEYAIHIIHYSDVFEEYELLRDMIDDGDSFGQIIDQLHMYGINTGDIESYIKKEISIRS